MVVPKGKEKASDQLHELKAGFNVSPSLQGVLLGLRFK